MKQGFLAKGWAVSERKDAKGRKVVRLAVVSLGGAYSELDLPESRAVDLARELLRAAGVPKT